MCRNACLDDQVQGQRTRVVSARLQPDNTIILCYWRSNTICLRIHCLRHQHIDNRVAPRSVVYTQRTQGQGFYVLSLLTVLFSAQSSRSAAQLLHTLLSGGNSFGKRSAFDSAQAQAFDSLYHSRHGGKFGHCDRQHLGVGVQKQFTYFDCN